MPTLRIGIHTGEVQRANAGGHTGPAVDIAAQLCNFARAGQTVISSGTEEAVHGRLPDLAWLVGLGAVHRRGRSRQQRISQVCYPYHCASGAG